MTKMQYLSKEKIADFISSVPAVVIHWNAYEILDGASEFNREIAAEQFAVEVFVYCVKSDDEADYQWWDEKFLELAEAENLDSANVQFVIYPDDENDPR